MIFVVRVWVCYGAEGLFSSYECYRVEGEYFCFIIYRVKERYLLAKVRVEPFVTAYSDSTSVRQLLPISDSLVFVKACVNFQ